jgi:hypothetical protein
MVVKKQAVQECPRRLSDIVIVENALLPALATN